MITARDMAVSAAVPYAPRPVMAGAPAYGAPLAGVTAVPFRERLLLVILYITVLASSIAVIEPSPHDALMGVLAVTCVVAGVRFHRKLTLLFLFLLIWNVSGLMSLLNVVGEEKTTQYAATSLYLAVAALIWACLFAENTMMRLAVLRKAYILTATIGALAGISGYLRAFPHAFELFAHDGRALGMFKDPNVYAPFLIWPILIMVERMLARRITLGDILVSGILLLALLLAFSRGAWFHFAVSGLALIALCFATAPTMKARLRVFYLAIVTVAAMAALVVVLLSIPSIGSMFTERAQLIQSYDVGEGGRFRLQELALQAVLQNPNGMGPFGFASTQTNQQHNVYLQGFLVYGWTGGMAYIILVCTTLLVGLRTAFVRTPWQPYAIVTFAVFVGEAAEGFIIDSDHWRHFFLLLGMSWGLMVATIKYVHREQLAAPLGQSVCA